MARLLKTQIGSTLHLHDTTPSSLATVQKAVQEGLERGLLVVHRSEGGWSEWHNTYPVCDTSQAGSRCYTWDSTGNRCLHVTEHVRKDPDGTITRTHVRTSYRKLDY